MKGKVTQTNLEDIIEVHNKIIEFNHKTKKDFEKRLGRKKRILLTYKLGKQSVAYLIGYKENKNTFYIWMAGTIKKYREKGAMTALMNYAEKWAKKEGYKKIKLKTRNTRREQLTNLIKRKYFFTKVEGKKSIEENRVYLEKPVN